MPNQTIVNRDAVGGNQATRDNSPVEAANISTVSFTDSSITIIFYTPAVCVNE